MQLTKTEILNNFETFCKKENIKIDISFSMPKGYENAYGTFDAVKNILFANFNLLKTNYCNLFYLFHELRHAKQYINKKLFSKELQKSLDYVVLYDGTCYKLKNNKWKKSKLKANLDFLNLYKNLPYEIDANKYAFKKMKKLINKDEYNTLIKIYKNTLPTIKIKKKEIQNLFNTIDEKIK